MASGRDWLGAARRRGEERFLHAPDDAHGSRLFPCQRRTGAARAGLASPSVRARDRDDDRGRETQGRGVAPRSRARVAPWAIPLRQVRPPRIGPAGRFGRAAPTWANPAQALSPSREPRQPGASSCGRLVAGSLATPRGQPAGPAAASLAQLSGEALSPGPDGTSLVQREEFRINTRRVGEEARLQHLLGDL